ncbi:hypothetical protein TBLA_0E01100 [Henningerozyma blattae CBS 6284]|uniref:Prokaryotic-type class I peptide chain release factors domain-containing protein n=1 Tax=Henningerozyma blattae (strain ATCC 34711 / CBS 6284 / DSM 70876 / NBRC 10599 / NRRL Y-10934 / UCD 77-7) TaxID=1071380 RepID=I2H468_HENB6|nr:hypothetical protein TBLA_0E01100 [Tetrapisispora blattae CBS 6284]CCH61170.1 hypothetical protein TBLA_0E01100 [Tetrapisispora blattae CBS 6284]
MFCHLNVVRITKPLCRNFNIQNGKVLIKKNKFPPRPKLGADDENDIEETFLHGGRGPGGQKINKTNSKVQLKHLPSGVIITCQETRSRARNRDIAREKLALKLAELKGDTRRQDALVEWEQQSKRSKAKKSRQKHEQAKMNRELERQRELEQEEKLIETMMNATGKAKTTR